MGPVDVVVLALVAAALALVVRHLVRVRGRGCSGCASRGSCAARGVSAACPVARDMLRNAERSLGGSAGEGAGDVGS